MKITGLRTRAIEIPFDKPIGTAIHRIEGVAGLLVWLDTDEGITGCAYLFAYTPMMLKPLMALVNEVGPELAG